MTGLLTDKVAIVTGAGQGVGEGIARALAGEGAHLVLADIDGDAVEAAAADLREGSTRALAVATDVRDPETVEALFEAAWGGKTEDVQRYISMPIAQDAATIAHSFC